MLNDKILKPKNQTCLKCKYQFKQTTSDMEKKRGGGIKKSVRIYLKREDCGSCGRRVGAKVNIWMQNGKHDMHATQLRKMQKRRLLVLKTIKKTSFVLANKCAQKTWM